MTGFFRRGNGRGRLLILIDSVIQGDWRKGEGGEGDGRGGRGGKGGKGGEGEWVGISLWIPKQKHNSLIYPIHPGKNLIRNCKIIIIIQTL